MLGNNYYFYPNVVENSAFKAAQYGWNNFDRQMIDKLKTYSD